MSKHNYGFFIEVDDCPVDPRVDNTNLCHMSFHHNRLNIGDVDARFDTNQFSGWGEVRKWLKNEKDAAVIVKVSATDHSTFRIYPGEPKDEWDSGIIGFAWVDHSTLNDEFGSDEQKAIEAINDEIKEYDHYLNDTFYVAFIYDDDAVGKPIIDSCGSFSDKEEAEEWAKSTIAVMEEND